MHAGLFARALEALRSGADLSKRDVYLCPARGHLELGVPPAKCPICGAPAAR